MADLLFELFCEEIPARMQAGALAHLQKILEEKLGAESKGFVTPRRLAVIINDLPATQPDISKEIKGPKTSAPEQALNGFLKKNGMMLDQLEDRDGVYFAKIEKKGEPTAELLKTIIEEMPAHFPWPKSMRWGSGDTSWVRPLHSIVCIFDGKVIPVEFAGIKAGNTTLGHRFLAPDVITLKNAASYEKALEKAFVIADREVRKASILKQAYDVAKANGAVLKQDDGLLEEVTGLVEWPVVLAGKIDAGFMDLPREVLISEMRAHQKYFACEDKGGEFSDVFLITANITANDDGKAIIAGNERVLRARLADGRFFWDQDRKKKLEEWAEGLKTVTFHKDLGSIDEKVSRIEKLAEKIADTTGADKTQVQRAARLCKADLVTGMVGEFPDLQGVMGRYYATAQGEDQKIANAIRDHYLPLGPASPLPSAPISICVALADKIDTLISMFAIGQKPTGSKDPFALRRSALGVIRIILENNLRLSLAKLNVEKDLLSFFHDRLIVQMKDFGIRHDVIKAVIANGDDDLLRIVTRAKALQEFLDTENGANLLAGYKRAANIVAIEEKKDKTSYGANIDQKLLSQIEENNLANVLEKNHAQIDDYFKQEKFTEMMALLSDLRNPVDQFFDKIMVNCEDKELRANRLRLLASITEAMNMVADFSKIEGDVKEQKKAA